MRKKNASTRCAHGEQARLRKPAERPVQRQVVCGSHAAIVPTRRSAAGAAVARSHRVARPAGGAYLQAGGKFGGTPCARRITRPALDCRPSLRRIDAVYGRTAGKGRRQRRQVAQPPRGHVARLLRNPFAARADFRFAHRLRDCGERRKRGDPDLRERMTGQCPFTPSSAASLPPATRPYAAIRTAHAIPPRAPWGDGPAPGQYCIGGGVPGSGWSPCVPLRPDDGPSAGSPPALPCGIVLPGDGRLS